MVLEIQSQIVCQSGFEEEPELQWKDDQKRAMEPCRWAHTGPRPPLPSCVGGGVEGCRGRGAGVQGGRGAGCRGEGWRPEG